MPAFQGEYHEDFQYGAFGEEGFKDEDRDDADYVEEDEGDDDQAYSATGRTSRAQGSEYCMANALRPLS